MTASDRTAAKSLKDSLLPAVRFGGGSRTHVPSTIGPCLSFGRVPYAASTYL